MNGEQAERFQELLEEACDHHIEYDGGKVIVQVFHDNKGGQCPLSCLFGRVGVDVMAKEASSMLETTVAQNELWALINTFDGFGVARLPETSKQYVSAMLIGKALRAKYITKG